MRSRHACVVAVCMPDIRTETMTVNMGPQHPSTHGVLRLVLELDGETVLSVAPTIGYLHTGIEKTAEQKKWQHWTERCALVEQLIREGEAPPYAAVKCLANQQLGPLEDRRIGRIARQLLSGAVVIPESRGSESGLSDPGRLAISPTRSSRPASRGVF